MTEPQNLAELIGAMKAAIAKRETAVGEAYLQATSVVLNLAHRLVKAAERMKGELGCLTPDYPCEKWPCTTPGKPLCGHCQALADADRLAKGE